MKDSNKTNLKKANQTGKTCASHLSATPSSFFTKGRANMDVKKKDYEATSRTGEVETFNSKLKLNYGFFARTLTDCNKCNWTCKKGTVAWIGASKGTRKSFQGCMKNKYEIEVVKLVKNNI